MKDIIESNRESIFKKNLLRFMIVLKCGLKKHHVIPSFLNNTLMLFRHLTIYKRIGLMYTIKINIDCFTLFCLFCLNIFDNNNDYHGL
jgi:hypothetical protein